MPVWVDREDLQKDTLATLASYMLKKGIGHKSANPESRVMHQWAKGFMPNLTRAMHQVEETVGVVPPGLSKIRQMMARKVAGVRMIAKCSKRNKSHNRRGSNPIKYGVLVPKTPEQAKEIDRGNSNNIWGDAMFVEAQSQIDHTTYLFLGPEEEIPEGYQKVELRNIFDVKQDLCRKARTIARGHKVDAFDINRHSSNMEGISARLLMLIADANGYDVHMGDIKNAYLYAPTAEKVGLHVVQNFPGLSSTE